MSAGRETGWAATVNLLVPGAGIILLGRTWLGLFVGLVFVLCANYALWATLLIPDTFSLWMRGLSIGLAGGAYVGAQLRLVHTARRQRLERRTTLRREALAAAQAALQREDYAAAEAAIEPVRPQAEHDLLVAYRLAQIETGRRDVEAARAAWQRVRALDRHRIYRAQIRTGEEALERLRHEPQRRPQLGPDRV